jgi:hypothetical protein
MRVAPPQRGLSPRQDRAICRKTAPARELPCTPLVQTVKVEIGSRGFQVCVEREGERRRGTFEGWQVAASAITDWLGAARGPIAVSIDGELVALTAADECVPFLNAVVARRTSQLVAA